jgi:hypothetical protein
LFAGIDRENVLAMMGCIGGHVQKAEKNQPIFREGDPAVYVGLVLSGAVRMERADYNGNRSIIALAGAGELFGETYACAGIPALPVSFIADEAAQVLKAEKRLRRQEQRISDVSRELLLKVHDRVYAFAETITPLIRSPRPAIDIEAIAAESKSIREFIRDCRKTQLGRVGADDPDSPLRVLCELDVINAYDRARSCYLNIAETLSGGKHAAK